MSSSTKITATIENLKADNIIPDCIPLPAYHEFPVSIEIKYKAGVEVQCGNEILLDNTSYTPRTITFSSTPPENKEYILVMTCPDSPSVHKHSSREYVHWVVGGIRGNTLKNGSDGHATTLLPYNAPKVMQGCGSQRFVFFLFLAPANFVKKVKGCPPATGDSRFAQKRENFGGTISAWNFKEINGLELVGINWFRSEKR